MTGSNVRVLLLTELNTTNRVSAEIVRAFACIGAEVTIATTRPWGPLHEALKREGIQAQSLGCSRAIEYVAGARRLIRMAGALQIDVVHAAEPIPGAVAGIARRFNRRFAVVYNRQHVSSDAWQQGLLSRIASHLADVVMPVSRASAEAARKLDRIPAEKICVGYNGAPELRHASPAELLDMKARLGISHGDAVISTIARIRPEKGHRTLIAALPWVQAELGRKVHLIVAGTGPSEAEVRQQAAASPLATQVHFVGYQADVGPWNAIADVVVVPSYRDACPIALIEAMCMGRPIVASAVGGIPELIEDNVSGLLVPAANEANLAAAILSLLRSRELSEELGKRGRARYEERFSVPAMVRGWLTAYHRAAQRARN